MLIIASKKLSANEAILVASCEEREGKLSDKHSIRLAKKVCKSQFEHYHSTQISNCLFCVTLDLTTYMYIVAFSI